ncbi:hypothetical protein SEA_BAZZLE_133 [Mycobacterium phage Bazzle]
MSAVFTLLNLAAAGVISYNLSAERKLNAANRRLHDANRELAGVMDKSVAAYKEQNDRFDAIMAATRKES